MTKTEFEILKLKNRIALMKSRPKDNQQIIKKCLRQIAALEKSQAI